MNQDIIYKNEQIKRKFFGYLRDSEGFEENSIDAFAKAVELYEDYTTQGDFAEFGKRRALGFKEWLKVKQKKTANESYSLRYQYNTLRRLNRFFEWLSKQTGYRSKINPTHVDYLRLSKKETRIATQSSKREIPSMDEIKTVLEHIAPTTEVDMRDRALISLMILTGARISAVASIPIRSFNEQVLLIDQDPRLGVKTKFAKRIPTRLFQLPYDKPLTWLLEWREYLVGKKKFTEKDPLFPATLIENGEENISYHNTGNVVPIFWRNANAIRRIFERRFAEAGVKYYHPHSLRHLVVRELTKIPLTEEEKKAISQNLGHEDVSTTFGSYGYGQIGEERQLEIVGNITFDGKGRQTKYALSKDELKELVKELKGE